MEHGTETGRLDPNPGPGVLQDLQTLHGERRLGRHSDSEGHPAVESNNTTTPVYLVSAEGLDKRFITISRINILFSPLLLSDVLSVKYNKRV